MISMQKETNSLPPFFSIVIPTYNSALFINETLLSVLGQTYEDYEVIISDDGSTDDTIRVIEEISVRFPQKRITILRNAHEGPGAARNSGIEAAKSEWIAFLDSDDRWFSQKLQRVAEIILKDKAANLICHNEIWKKDGKETLFDYAQKYDPKIHPFLSLYRRNTLSPSAVVVKRNLIVRSGMFDASLPSAQDYDLWLRMAMLSELRLVYIDEALSLCLSRKGSISSNIEKRLECLMRINKKYYWKLKEIAGFPLMERLRYEGRWYAWAGLQLIRRKEISRGFALLIKGIAKWPFRFDWLLKMINSKISGVQ